MGLDARFNKPGPPKPDWEKHKFSLADPMDAALTIFLCVIFGCFIGGIIAMAFVAAGKG